ncbi:hypothetical protein [Marseilla massiliensis]|uniref:Uncharacterized protein n=1 Tax=Marseilla massiliensis TaxID=1841864 RepID=A0A939B6S7_9BACT|nr:hypothetical protein [Marseilla massiliensis]MBM6674589.1 hypothetical protein [Marseilla massiliensis]
MKTYAYFLRYALLALPLVCAFALSSCYNDEDGDCPGGNEPVEVRLNVSAQQIGDLNGTRAGGDGLADEHEFMHSLRVYIVNEAGSVMQSFERNPAALEAYSTAASTGDLTNWSSESFELAPGEYTVYAFANFEGHQGFAGGVAQPADNFINTCFEGSTVNTIALNGFTVADPAGKIKFVSDGSGEVVYIPMSASQRITVTANTHDISIGLVRLVGKVQLTVSPDNAEIGQDATVTFSGYSQNVPLMESDQTGATGGNAYIYNTDRSLYGKRDASTGEIPLTGYDPNAGTTYSFYVNETPTPNVEAGEGGFTVTLNTGKTDNDNTGGVMSYESRTSRTDIPRNHVYQLTLRFDNYDLQLNAKAGIRGIGGYLAYVVAVDETTYVVSITYGTWLSIEAALANIDGTSSFTWRADDYNPDGMDDYAATGNSVDIMFSGSASIMTNTYTFYLDASWTDGGNTYNRTYTVIVSVDRDYNDVIDEVIENMGINSTRSSSAVLPYEWLNMVKVKK